MFALKNVAQPLSYISIGTTVIPSRNKKQRLCKVSGGKEGLLWEMCKWRMQSFPQAFPKAAVTLIWVSERFGHPHSQNPGSDMDIPFSYYLSDLG